MARYGFVCAGIVFAMLVADANAAQWMDDYAEALAEARRQRRPLLIVIEKPAIPNHRITQVSVTSDVTGSALLGPYVLCRIDATTPLGKQVARSFRATSFPYTVITDKSTRYIVYRKGGQFSDLDWATLLISHRDGGRPTFAYAPIQARPAMCST